jgi:formate dehydrogenase maturation protein FdhE
MAAQRLRLIVNTTYNHGSQTIQRGQVRLSAMPATCKVCPICGSTEVQATIRKTITVCHCLNCKAVWHVVPDAEPSAA